jgi:Flp pilus assembly protein TadG
MTDLTNSKHRTRSRFLRRIFRAAREDRGSSFVELGLVMPLFLVIFAAGVEIAQLGYFAIEATDAAKAGAIYGAQSSATASSTTAIQLAASNNAPRLTTMGALTVNSSIACQCASGTSFATFDCSKAATACVSPNRTVKYVQVDTSAVVSSFCRYAGLPQQFTVHGLAVMRIK